LVSKKGGCAGGEDDWLFQTPTMPNLAGEARSASQVRDVDQDNIYERNRPEHSPLPGLVQAANLVTEHGCVLDEPLPNKWESAPCVAQLIGKCVDIIIVANSSISKERKPASRQE
jgi:hypothetical protein